MRRTGRALAALICLFVGVEAAAATRYDPRLRFRTIRTARFDIHYHQGEEALAQRLARLAEEVATTLARTLGPASGRVQVILVDQNDLPNGWATPLPYNTIEITVAVPAADSVIGNVDDWLRMVFTHEYVHIVHLSRGAGWIGGLRKVFGRLPVLYPNAYLPIWQIEGIATWQESAQTGGGRVPAGDFRVVLETAAAEKRLEPIDRASGRLVDWPSGDAPYLYGAYFHKYLADTYGDEALRRLTDESARRLPYFGARAFRKVFGKPLGDLWKEFEASVAPADAAAAEARRVTRHGFYVSGPRFAGGGRIFYSLFDPHGFPSLMEADVASGETRAVTKRFLGEQVSIAGDQAIFDQIDIIRNVGLQSDLYAVSLSGGDTRRLSYGARAADADVSPDGRTLVFTVQRADRRELAMAPLAPAFQFTPATVSSAPDVHFGSPRWSPDGTLIAAERRLRGGHSEIVIVDSASGAVRLLVPTGRNAGPVWSPDGSTIFFAAALDDEPFQILSVAASGGDVRKLEGTGRSAHSPALSPDGSSLAFVGYTADGYDIFTLPLKNARWTPAVPPAPAKPAAAEPASTPLPSRAYSPLRTLLPQFWTPTIESDEGETVIGAATGSLDALGRHAYVVEGGWGARARPDWQIAYAYDRWQPTFYAVFSDDTDPWRGGERRTQEGNAGMLLATRRIRWTQTVLAELHGSRETFESAVDRLSVRSGLSFDTARMYGYSISPEEGGRIKATVESTRSPSLSGLSAAAATIDGRYYLRAWPRHAAIALRGAAAGAWGDAPLRRLFSASGNDPQLGGFTFGSGAIGLIRGLDEDDLLGTRAAVINADYRFKIAHVERGIGTLPFFLRAVHAAVFVDAGHAWSGRFRSSDIRYSAGAEVSIDTILGYFAPLTLAAGGAWRDGPDPDGRGFAAFVRVGRAF
jgi:Tol biopolymer transport system component